MNNKFDELPRGLTQPITRTLLCMAVAAQFALPTRANDFRLGPIMDLSDPNALAACGANSAEKECSLAVNPINPKNVVAAWIGGSFKGIVAAVSFDSGKRWQQVVLPELTVCAGANWSFDVAADPWLSFAPDGDLYLTCGVSLLFQDFPVAIVVSKS